MQQVSGSSNIDAMGYVPGGNGTGTLTIRFKSGAKYQYTGVEESIWRDFQAASSKGAFFAANIRGNPSYPVSKV